MIRYKPNFHDDGPDWAIEASPSTMAFIKHLERHGGRPSSWRDPCCRARRVEEGDRVFHELKTLSDVLEMAGTYDQYNLAKSAAMEGVSRRWQTIIEAYEVTPQKPNYESARLFAGTGSPLDASTPELRAQITKKALEEADVEK